MRKFLKNKKGLLFFVFSVLIIISIFCFKLLNKNLVFSKKKSCPSSFEVVVTKVIDGDTILVEGGYHIRLLGIDADEKDYPCYLPAKKYLENLILGKKVRLERDKEDVDKYGRCLRYVFLNGKNVNLLLVKNGFAVARFYLPNLKYYKEIQNAEKFAKEHKIGCKWKKK